MDSDFKGPLPNNTVGLLLGRSSSALKGLVITPGVIDSDYSGTVKILCSSPRGITAISPGDRIAQILVLPSLHNKFSSENRSRGERGLGSSGIDLSYLSLELDDRPIIQLEIEGIPFQGLLDAGADRSIIASKVWPRRWPLQSSSQTLQGLGYAKTPDVSSKELTWRTQEGQRGRVTPYVVDIPITLWGRDILTQMGMKLTTEYSPQSQQMMKHMGHVPGMGLGKRLQGRIEPLVADDNPGTRGLGFS